MTFIIEAIKGDQHTAQIRSSAMDAVILARKLAADGFAVSITDPSGHRHSADQFIRLLASSTTNTSLASDVHQFEELR